jgi:Rhodopsin-like GPCR transmembrane domain
MDSWPGKLLVLLRLCLLSLFLSGGMVTLNNEVTHKRRDFVHRLLIAGTGWFAALPLVVLIASICAPYLREQVSVLCRTEQYCVGTQSSCDATVVPSILLRAFSVDCVHLCTSGLVYA